MILSLDDLAALRTGAETAARAAATMIAQSRPAEIEHKAANSLASQVVTEIDRAAQAIILEALVPLTESFDLGILTEESPDDGSRFRKAYFWCIDPIDGTLPFIEDRPGYAVSIALVAGDGTPVIGVVFDPVTATLYSAAANLGTRINDRPLVLGEHDAATTLDIYADRNFGTSAEYAHFPKRLERLAQELGLTGISIHTGAGAVINACQVLTRPSACYFKVPKPQNGGGCLWDFAATACLFAEAGAIATDIHGHRLDLNRADSTYMNHRGVIYATNETLAAHLRLSAGG